MPNVLFIFRSLYAGLYAVYIYSVLSMNFDTYTPAYTPYIYIYIYRFWALPQRLDVTPYYNAHMILSVTWPYIYIYTSLYLYISIWPRAPGLVWSSGHLEGGSGGWSGVYIYRFSSSNVHDGPADGPADKVRSPAP